MKPYTLFLLLLLLSNYLFGRPLKVVVSGETGDFFLSVELTNLTNKDEVFEVLASENEDVLAEKKEFQFKDIKPGKYILAVHDHHPGITSSCLFARVIEVAAGEKMHTEELNFQKRKLSLHIHKSNLPKNIEGALLIGRFRKIDKIGKVSRWIVFQKNEQKIWTVNPVGLQNGRYLFELFEKDDKVKIANQEIGGLYPCWSSIILISDEKEFEFNSE